RESSSPRARTPVHDGRGWPTPPRQQIRCNPLHPLPALSWSSPSPEEIPNCLQAIRRESKHFKNPDQAFGIGKPLEPFVEFAISLSVFCAKAFVRSKVVPCIEG